MMSTNDRHTGHVHRCPLVRHQQPGKYTGAHLSNTTSRASTQVPTCPTPPAGQVPHVHLSNTSRASTSCPLVRHQLECGDDSHYAIVNDDDDDDDDKKSYISLAINGNSHTSGMNLYVLLSVCVCVFTQNARTHAHFHTHTHTHRERKY